MSLIECQYSRDIVHSSDKSHGIRKEPGMAGENHSSSMERKSIKAFDFTMGFLVLMTAVFAGAFIVQMLAR
jgi:hypothetical protein